MFPSVTNSGLSRRTPAGSALEPSHGGQFTCLAGSWHRFKVVVVIVFVGWHLFALLVRNPLDLWGAEIEKRLKGGGWWESVGPTYERADRWTLRYVRRLGIEQGWTMFSPPVARGAPFLAVQIHFDDGSEELLLADNEPDPTSYFRIGGWRQRKLEDYMVYGEETSLATDEELPLWEAYVRWRVKRWRQSNPGDTRNPAWVVLLRRRMPFPELGDAPDLFPPIRVHEIGKFRPDGKLIVRSDPVGKAQ